MQLFVKFIVLLFLSVFSFAVEIQKPLTYENQEISGWVMSEKLDGIRGYWDGKQLLTRKGKKIYMPKWFIKNFPDFELDGELWTKRDDFENIQNIVMDQKPSNYWENVTYNIFEVPNTKGDFFKRLDKAKFWFKTHPNKYVKIIKQIKIEDENHLNFYLEDIIKKKGEGLIIKDPTKDYHTGRTPHVLKIKNFQDMEGIVVGININEKTDLLKSLVIKLDNNITFNLGNGFTKEQRIKGFKIGTIVTFKYYGFTKYGKPKFASFIHERKD
jgi:DNA ligase-1